MKILRILIFNFFTRAYLNRIDRFPFINSRLRIMGTDFSFVLSLIFPLLLIIMIPSIILTFNDPNQITDFNLFDILWLISFSFFTFILINKDFFNGQSIAKRKYGFQIIDNKSRKVANEIQCMVRNVTLIIWPLEVLFTLIQPKRRLGDLIAGTRLIETSKSNPESILTEMNSIQNFKSYRLLIVLSILFALFFNLLSFLPMLALTNKY